MSKIFHTGINLRKSVMNWDGETKGRIFTIPTYRRHHCDRVHSSYHAWAKCAYKGQDVYVMGEGEWALISKCAVSPGKRNAITVLLYTSKAKAVSGRQYMDAETCGGRCLFNAPHDVVRIDLNGNV